MNVHSVLYAVMRDSGDQSRFYMVKRLEPDVIIVDMIRTDDSVQVYIIYITNDGNNDVSIRSIDQFLQLICSWMLRNTTRNSDF